MAKCSAFSDFRERLDRKDIDASLLWSLTIGIGIAERNLLEVQLRIEYIDSLRCVAACVGCM